MVMPQGVLEDVACSKNLLFLSSYCRADSELDVSFGKSLAL